MSWWQCRKVRDANSAPSFRGRLLAGSTSMLHRPARCACRLREVARTLRARSLRSLLRDTLSRSGFLPPPRAGHQGSPGGSPRETCEKAQTLVLLNSNPRPPSLPDGRGGVTGARWRPCRPPSRATLQGRLHPRVPLGARVLTPATVGLRTSLLGGQSPLAAPAGRLWPSC